MRLRRLIINELKAISGGRQSIRGSCGHECIRWRSTHPLRLYGSTNTSPRHQPLSTVLSEPNMSPPGIEDPTESLYRLLQPFPPLLIENAWRTTHRSEPTFSRSSCPPFMPLAFRPDMWNMGRAFLLRVYHRLPSPSRFEDWETKTCLFSIMMMMG